MPGTATAVTKEFWKKDLKETRKFLQGNTVEMDKDMGDAVVDEWQVGCARKLWSVSLFHSDITTIYGHWSSSSNYPAQSMTNSYNEQIFP